MMDLQRILNRNYLPESEINIKLVNLYASKWDSFILNIKSKKETAYPYLVTVNDRYINARTKVLIFGQETQCWGGEFYNEPEIGTINNLMGLYDLFVNQDLGYNSPYWRFVRFLINESDKNIGFIFSNVVRIGKPYDAGCDDEINALTLQYFNIAKEELAILNPDIILFLTGPRYDNHIKEVFGNFSIAKISKEYTDRQFVRLTFDNQYMPTAFRCYHPRYLNYIKSRQKYINKFLDVVKQECIETLQYK